jgi:hypothetical protein
MSSRKYRHEGHRRLSCFKFGELSVCIRPISAGWAAAAKDRIGSRAALKGRCRACVGPPNLRQKLNHHMSCDIGGLMTAGLPAANMLAVAYRIARFSRQTQWRDATPLG